ncbi:hypothetical protein OUZ56_025424 [Daphnia magna]|uniref:Uncharacterized protein n=1 Tax=Daphnia magna TaxID=35525 RepID=A0ABQ9ZJT2_9CRUS|nr:hypothetical protein OUZ56_025424 [Daphnia magna]
MEEPSVFTAMSRGISALFPLDCKRRDPHRRGRTDISRTVVQHVLCEGKRIPAVIDTVAIVSVCSPGLVNHLGLRVRTWQANQLVAIYGKEIKPGGAATLEVSDGETNVKGEVLVLEGDIDLLLEKDFLEKLGTRMKIGSLPEFFNGNLPIGTLVEEKREERAKLLLELGQGIPVQTMVVVGIKPLDMD